MLEESTLKYQLHTESPTPFVLVLPGCLLSIGEDQVVSVLPFNETDELEVHQALTGYVKTLLEAGPVGSRQASEVISWLNGEFYTAEIDGKSYPIRVVPPVASLIETVPAPKAHYSLFLHALSQLLEKFL